MANIEGVRHFSAQPLFNEAAVRGGAVWMGDDFLVASSQCRNYETQVLVEDLPEVPPIMSVHEVWRWISKHQSPLLP